ncbi:MAG: DUF302 domain-containing protein [Chromatiales bacterium]|nr:DUF302 domain-containing protein [Chromatiales bacterium]
MLRIILFTLSLAFACLVWAGSPHVYEKTVSAPLEAVYPKLHDALEARKFWVIFEPNIGRNIAGMAERWGEDYNRQNLTGIRAMAVCNPWYTNQIANKDPSMLALCPLHVSLYEKDGKTTLLLLLPAAIAGDSPAAAVLEEVQQILVEAIDAAAQ